MSPLEKFVWLQSRTLSSMTVPWPAAIWWKSSGGGVGVKTVPPGLAKAAL